MDQTEAHTCSVMGWLHRDIDIGRYPVSNYTVHGLIIIGMS